MPEQLQNYFEVKKELIIRIEDLLEKKENSVYGETYQIETLKQQLIITEKLIQKELSKLNAEELKSRKEVSVEEKIKILTNIDTSIPINNKIINDEVVFLPVKSDIEIEIKSTKSHLNEVFISSSKKTTLKENEVIGYIIPKELEDKKIR